VGLVTSCVLVSYLFLPTVGCNLCEKLQIFVAASLPPWTRTEATRMEKDCTLRQQSACTVRGGVVGSKD